MKPEITNFIDSTLEEKIDIVCYKGSYVGVRKYKELLKLGLAWHYKQYNKDEELAKLEQEARKKKVGL